MPVELLESLHVRNLQTFRIHPAKRFNIFTGDNGSGKTSILESLHLLSVGRSFRTHLIRRVINQHQTQLSIFGILNNDADTNDAGNDSNPTIPIGIEKQENGDTRIKIAGKNVSNVAELAVLLPTQVINNDSFDLLTAGPKVRRQFMDWGLFHVEQSFFSVWKQYLSALKQRNAALKMKLPMGEIRSWNSMLVPLANKMDSYRKQYVVAIEKHLLILATQLLNVPGLAISYHSGWPKGENLENLLEESLGRDIALGFTQYGPHRADMAIKISNTPAQDLLSRGQQKLLVCALQLAQGAILAENSNKRCCFLIDDLPSELDPQSLAKILGILAETNAQVFITAIIPPLLDRIIDRADSRLFHVKHGIVSEA